MPAVMVTAPTAIQNSPFFPRWWLTPKPVLIARRVRWINTGMADLPKVVTSQSTNWAPHSLTLLRWSKSLHQTRSFQMDSIICEDDTRMAQHITIWANVQPKLIDSHQGIFTKKFNLELHSMFASLQQKLHSEFKILLLLKHSGSLLSYNCKKSILNCRFCV